MDAIRERVKSAWAQGELSPVSKWKFLVYTDVTLWAERRCQISLLWHPAALSGESPLLQHDPESRFEEAMRCSFRASVRHDKVLSKWLVLALVSYQQTSSALHFGLFFLGFVMADKIWRKSCEFFGNRSPFFGRRLVARKSEWVKVQWSFSGRSLIIITQDLALSPLWTCEYEQLSF